MMRCSRKPFAIAAEFQPNRKRCDMAAGTTKRKVGSPYSVHPSLAMAQNAIAKLTEKSGRSLDEWMTFIKKSGPPTEEARDKWLKDEHKLGTNYASWLAALSVGKRWDEGDPEAYMKAALQYVE